MYIAVDIGGTKTLVAALTNEGIIDEAIKFPTPKDYLVFLDDLTKTIASLKTKDFRAGCVAGPGEIDREKGIAKMFGNLPWANVHLVRDIEKITACPMRLENDAKLASLSEAMLLKNKYSRVLYITISTGIGIGLTFNGLIDHHIGDGGGRTMIFEHHGTYKPWETFASGNAIVKQYGKMASEINDMATWRKVVRNLRPGFIELIAILEPEVIVIGGGAGHYLDKFHDLLVADLKRYETPMLTIPPIIPAGRPDEAVIYGCYDYAKQKYA
jgi:predicted NBD/HSP70 family sugar kinase